MSYDIGARGRQAQGRARALLQSLIQLKNTNNVSLEGFEDLGDAVAGQEAPSGADPSRELIDQRRTRAILSLHLLVHLGTIVRLLWSAIYSGRRGGEARKGLISSCRGEDGQSEKARDRADEQARLHGNNEENDEVNWSSGLWAEPRRRREGRVGKERG